jgi:hypothetical protein
MAINLHVAGTLVFLYLVLRVVLITKPGKPQAVRTLFRILSEFYAYLRGISAQKVSLCSLSGSRLRLTIFRALKDEKLHRSNVEATVTAIYNGSRVEPTTKLCRISAQ